ncbi:methicillin resistance protein [Bifidobacterium lemurum]|uniref:Methicillin resistance protein n=1 Tax=Bifidobacterium lemurum TaxID=1603886 RepID=A0A261FP57_9BIFI|nr:aminoacyltransferase [Bifidobacterium lemurum]OZG60960.1 methicillin resistance protein [Bifidobacterium lemurum]QOL34758.1 aminoacyltransferase [Bifidobacterium lemurum]
MRSFTLVTLTPEQFDDFSAHHPQGNFQQTSAMGRLRERRGIEVEYLGVSEHGRIVAAALLETHRSRLSTFAAIHDGPLCDFHDVELVEFLTSQLKFHAKANGAAQLEITPEAPYMVRDSFGAAFESDAVLHAAVPGVDENAAARSDDMSVESLVAAGFRHGGFGTGYTAVPRWRYLKDLTDVTDERSLLKSYDKRTQWSVKRAQSMGVHVRELGEDELTVFTDIERQTAERRSFEYRGEEYFRQFKQSFGDSAHFMLAEIHMGEYVADMTAKRDALRSKVEALRAKNDGHPTTKTERQLGEETRNLEAAEKRLADAAEFAKRGDVLPAAASLFVEHPREVIYLFSGSVEDYKPFYASALIQHETMLRLCVERGVARYNFYGISGVFGDPDDEGRGVLEFKQGFNGYVEELLGEFELTVKPLTYAVKSVVRKLARR